MADDSSAADSTAATKTSTGDEKESTPFVDSNFVTDMNSLALSDSVCIAEVWSQLLLFKKQAWVESAVSQLARLRKVQ